MIAEPGGTISSTKRSLPDSRDEQERGEEDIQKPEEKSIVTTIYGPDARFSFELQLTGYLTEKNPRLRVSDLQDLLLYTLTPEEGEKPKWIFVKNTPLLQRIVLVLLRGLSLSEFRAHGDIFANTRARFTDPVPTQTPGDKSHVADALQVLFTCRKIKRKRRNKKQKKRIAEISAQGWTLEQLLLTDEQLRENDYPLMEAPFTLRSYAHAQSNEFVASTAGKGRTPVLAIDCEMVMTARGLELARVSALAWNGDPSSAETLVLDELVRPAAPVTDYLTQWSGITAEKLSDVSTTLGDVQQRLLDLIGESTILVGHSLENDLFALRLFHRRCIDTAVLFRNGRGFKCSLRSLAEKYLGESIQQSSGGHDSIQDARAALRLVRFAMWQPHQPGVVSFRMQDLNENQGVPLLELLSDLGRRVTLVSRASDPLLVPGSLSPTMRLCAVPSHADVWDAARRHLSEPAADPNPPLAPELTLIHWTELMEVQRAALSSGASSQSVVEARLEALRRAAAGLDQLLTCAPSGRALFLVSSLHGDTAFLSSKQRTNASNCSTLSPAEVEQARQQFQAAVAAARDAFTLLAVP